MSGSQNPLNLDGVPLVRLESDHLIAEVAPTVGGRVVSLVEKRGNHEFLWRNRGLKLQRLPPGSEYDPNFYGGIDELLPNDIPELIDQVNCPDHGELWTTPLDVAWRGQHLLLSGQLPLFGLQYQREMRLHPDSPCLEITCRISNLSDAPRHFLWKLHAALAVQPGDLIECPARKAQVVDPAWSRFRSLQPFDWPIIEGQAANIVPPPGNATDFFYLFDLARGEVAWRRPKTGLEFKYSFDTKVFPYVWLFASYGGFNGHFTVILEPCTAMPISVNEAAAKGQCSILRPGQALGTRVTIFAGHASEPAKEPHS